MNFDEMKQHEIEKNSCPVVGRQIADVCKSVTVTPFAKTGMIRTKCCGDPVVTPGVATCFGRKNGSCSFTIKQRICVEVPVDFGARVETGDTFVDCIAAAGKDICRDCKEKE